MDWDEINKYVNYLFIGVFIIGLIITWIVPIVVPQDIVNFMRNIINIIVWTCGFYATILSISFTNNFLKERDGRQLAPSMVMVLMSLALLWTSNTLFLSNDQVAAIRALMTSFLFSLWGILSLAFYIVYKKNSPFKMGFAFIDI